MLEQGTEIRSHILRLRSYVTRSSRDSHKCGERSTDARSVRKRARIFGRNGESHPADLQFHVFAGCDGLCARKGMHAELT